MRPADTTGLRSGVINDALDQFKAAIRSAGITPPEVIEPGRIQRFPGAGKRNNNTAGWCKLFDDGLGGCFGDWSSGFSGNWQAKRDKPLTATELGAFKRHVAEAQAQAEAERKAKQAEAATKAASIWRTARPARGDHPYLARKRVSPVASLREIDAAETAEMLGYAPKSRGEPLAGRLLVVPVKVAGELSTAELIDETGRKSALRGGAKAGGYWAAQPLEPSRSAGCSHVAPPRVSDGVGEGLTLLIGEGVATVLSAKQATGFPVIATVSCGNLLAVAREIRERYPLAVLVILADLVKVTGDPDPHAIEAARAVGGLLAIPDFGENRPEDLKDFNDLAVLRGLEAVQRAIADAKAPAGDGTRPGNGAAPSTSGGAGSGGEQARLQGVEIWVQSDPDKPSRLKPQVDILIDIGRQVAQALFLGDDDRAYAVVRDRSEVWPIASKRFREWLRGCYFTRVGKGANANSARDAIDTIEAEARYSGA